MREKIILTNYKYITAIRYVTLFCWKRDGSPPEKFKKFLQVCFCLWFFLLFNVFSSVKVYIYIIGH